MYYGGEDIALTSELKDYTIAFTPVNLSDAADTATHLKFSLGKFTDYSSGLPVKVDTPASTIVISNLVFVKVEE